MKLKIQFGGETRFLVPLQQTIQTKPDRLSGTMHEAWSRLRRNITKQRKAMKIPAGYQAETGFHFGVEPAE
jgi:hypothetical protein